MRFKESKTFKVSRPGHRDFEVAVPLSQFLSQGGTLKRGCLLICIENYECKYMGTNDSKYKIEFLNDKLYTKGHVSNVNVDDLKVRLRVTNSELVIAT